jgi:L-alanine-DL-glutamate epimerase-like enolase superfamily enzyme
METGVSSAASIHLGVVCPNLKHFDVAPPTDFIVEDIVEGIRWDGLQVEPNQGPGLGLQLREDLLSKYAIR